MHLRYSLEVADYERETRNPQRVIRELGITYQSQNNHRLSACWFFWNCEQVPRNLPVYVQEYKGDPAELIGDVLTEAEARAIKNRMPF